MKYGTYNWRDSAVDAATYYDAIGRHNGDWWEGEDYDADLVDEDGNSLEVHNLIGVIASAIVILDGIQQKNWIDNRPIAHVNPGWRKEMNKKYEAISALYPNKAEPFTQKKKEQAAKPTPPKQLSMFDILEPEAHYETYKPRNKCQCGADEC